MLVTVGGGAFLPGTACPLVHTPAFGEDYSLETIISEAGFFVLIKQRR